MKHADLIRAALDGKTIEWAFPGKNDWFPLGTVGAIRAMISEQARNNQYRIQPPPPPPDRVLYGSVYSDKTGETLFVDPATAEMWQQNNRRGLVKYTFDGVGGKLKSVEIVT